VKLDVPLSAIVASLAQAHERAKPELVHVPTVRLDVVADRHERGESAFEAEGAQGMVEKLQAADALPPGRAS
jgi:hypothetical protein